MSLAYTRPFQPLDFATEEGAVFPLEEMIQQLRREDVYRTAHRNALTLIRDEELTVVLVVARQGTECEDHYSPGATLFLVLEGDVIVASAVGGGVIHLRRGAAGALARDVRHHVAAISDCSYMLIMGPTSKSKELRRSIELAPGKNRTATSSDARHEVEGLVHRLVEHVDSLPASDRQELRSYVADVLATELWSLPTPAESEIRSNRRTAPLGFLSEAFLIGLVGFALLFVLPPVGIVLLLLSSTIAFAASLGQLFQLYRNPPT